MQLLCQKCNRNDRHMHILNYSLDKKLKIKISHLYQYMQNQLINKEELCVSNEF